MTTEFESVDPQAWSEGGRTSRAPIRKELYEPIADHYCILTLCINGWLSHGR